MSKVTLSTEFRKVSEAIYLSLSVLPRSQVDVDELDEEKYQDEPEAADDSDTIATRYCYDFLTLSITFIIREAEVKKLTTAGKNFDALKAALADPPVHTKDESAKVPNQFILINVTSQIETELLHSFGCPDTISTVRS